MDYNNQQPTTSVESTPVGKGNLEQRLRKGIEYFRGIKPSEWNYAHKLRLNVFLDLVERFLTSSRATTADPSHNIVDQAKMVFGVDNK